VGHLVFDNTHAWGHHPGLSANLPGRYVNEALQNGSAPYISPEDRASAAAAASVMGEQASSLKGELLGPQALAISTGHGHLGGEPATGCGCSRQAAFVGCCALSAGCLQGRRGIPRHAASTGCRMLTDKVCSAAWSVQASSEREA